ncbi:MULTISPECIES: NAD(P)H-dependent flavin oxidoreductase [Azospira]|jgi:nitronate monooxygenase|uniref:2-nitropropane dioxygenase-like enzyme n=2 Tax=Azospira oryzae TaxID=146939 RepID=G8QFF8_AZOOP|nr:MULTISPECIES: nitronate monooxygenase family protein [Azospira]TLS18529.1 MAG: nitronate monooxygenase [Betaproteobacteria bacterium]AEV26024.1 2-nitropropane dioxygenase-like enzyme [Azospira oryzae PS]MBP7488754.1 nitronate monooxygenase [Azospira sp.]MDK9690499.1 nitronate monooxygenase family protein [Azospira sp.]RZT75711.1 nitronate monooxygenase [Azospira oryzae]
MSSTAFPPLKIKGKTLVPIVQGGMGVGISAHRLAGTVASLNGVGTIASVDLRRHHPDLMAETGRSRNREAIEKANLIALDREIKMAQDIAQGRGVIAVNVMRAVTQYQDYVRQSCQSGAEAIVMGAGLPLDLPELTEGYPDVALVPILSDVRGIVLLLKKWMRKNRLPDAIVIEHPRYAGGHLGAAKKEDVNDPRFNFEVVIPGVLEAFEEMGIASEKIPLIPAGGINSHERVRELIDMGAAAVQLGSAFAVAEEGDADIEFKKVLAGAKDKDVVDFMSCAGLPARAVKTPWLEKYLNREEKLMAAAAGKEHKCTLAWDCLLQCGLRDSNPKHGQFCIDNQLAAAVTGDVQKGLFFRGASSLPFGSAIRPVRELMHYLLTGEKPVFT